MARRPWGPIPLGAKITRYDMATIYECKPNGPPLGISSGRQVRVIIEPETYEFRVQIRR